MARAKSCGRSDCGCGRKSRAFGAVTWLAVVFAIAVVGAALWFSLRPTAQQGQKAPQTTWFPEPAYLLDHSEELKITAAQRRQVAVVVREWAMTEAAFNAQLKSMHSDTDSAIEDLRSGRVLTGTYADLVSRFDTARSKAWKQATSYLTADQVAKLAKLRQADSKSPNEQVSRKS